jgi:calcineurin-like phosphoesterase family protein
LQQNLHGHLHTRTVDDRRYVWVSAEQINLTPIPYDEILNRWAEHH